MTKENETKEKTKQKKERNGTQQNRTDFRLSSTVREFEPKKEAERWAINS